MSQRGTLLIILVQNRHYFKRRSLGWHIVAQETWPSILLHEQTGSFYFLFFKFTVEASCFSTGLQLDLKVTKWWQLLLFACSTFEQSEKLKSGTSMFPPHDTCLRLICNQRKSWQVFFSLHQSIQPSMILAMKEYCTPGIETCHANTSKKQLICTNFCSLSYSFPFSSSPSQGLLWNQSICSGCVLCLKAIPIKSSLIRPALSEQNQSRAK